MPHRCCSELLMMSERAKLLLEAMLTEVAIYSEDYWSNSAVSSSSSKGGIGLHNYSPHPFTSCTSTFAYFPLTLLMKISGASTSTPTRSFPNLVIDMVSLSSISTLIYISYSVCLLTVHVNLFFHASQSSFELSLHLRCDLLTSNLRPVALSSLWKTPVIED